MNFGNITSLVVVLVLAMSDSAFNKQRIEKLELIITHKDELLAQKDKEIDLLRKLLANT